MYRVCCCAVAENQAGTISGKASGQYFAELTTGGSCLSIPPPSSVLYKGDSRTHARGHAPPQAACIMGMYVGGGQEESSDSWGTGGRVL